MGRHRRQDSRPLALFQGSSPELVPVAAHGAPHPELPRRRVRPAVVVALGGLATAALPLLSEGALPGVGRDVTTGSLQQAVVDLVGGATEGAASPPETARPAPLVDVAPVPVVGTGSGDATALRKGAVRARSTSPSREEETAPPDSEDVSTAEASTRGFVRPVTGRITSNFGPRWGTTHYGLDVANRVGTPIRSVGAGTVINAGPASGFGLWVRVRLLDGTVTVYGHINRALVRVGQRVEAGQLIAEVGNRGQSTGPHLHFETISADGVQMDPLAWLQRRGAGDVAAEQAGTTPSTSDER